MKVSVIIPVYNCETLVIRAINSVKSQSYKDWELIVVDDCSTDGTYAACEKLVDEKVRLIKQPKNTGAGIARQTGLKYATGDFVTFLDSDDYFTPEFLEGLVTLQKQHDSDLVYSSFTVRYEKEGVDKVIPAGDYIMSGSATVQLYYWNEIKFLTGKLIRRSLCDTIPWSNRRVGEDCQTLYFLLYNSKQVRSSSFTGYIHVFRPGSLLADKPFFYCFCWSTLAQIDIVEFLKNKYYSLLPSDPMSAETKKLLDFELAGIKKNFDEVKKHVASGQFKVGAEYKEWDRIKKWFDQNKRLFL